VGASVGVEVGVRDERLVVVPVQLVLHSGLQPRDRHRECERHGLGSHLGLDADLGVFIVYAGFYENGEAIVVAIKDSCLCVTVVSDLWKKMGER